MNQRSESLVMLAIFATCAYLVVSICSGFIGDSTPAQPAAVQASNSLVDYAKSMSPTNVACDNFKSTGLELSSSMRRMCGALKK